jgi:hypothetical protein
MNGPKEHVRMLCPLISSNVFRPRSPLKGREAIQQMADDMRIAATQNGGVTSDDLALIGWSRAQIIVHGDAARELAQRLADAA